MRNVILYIDNTEILDYVIDRPEISGIDPVQFTVVLQLSELSKEVIPLIGDLSELRAQKYLRLLNEWYQEQTIKFKFFNPVVLQSNFKVEDIERIMNQEIKNDFYVYDQVYSKLSKTIDKLDGKYKISLHVIRPEDDLKAGE